MEECVGGGLPLVMQALDRTEAREEEFEEVGGVSGSTGKGDTSKSVKEGAVLTAEFEDEIEAVVEKLVSVVSWAVLVCCPLTILLCAAHV